MKKNKIGILLFSLIFSSFFIKIFAKENIDYLHLHIVDIEHPISFKEIKERYQAFDFVDGDLTKNISFQSTYEDDFIKNDLKVKNYDLFIYITNSRNVTTTKKDEISVRDFLPPTIVRKELELFIDISKENLNQKLTENFKITDNYDPFPTLILEDPDEKYQQAGIYNTTVYAIDSSGNQSEKIEIILNISKSIQRQLSLNPILITTNPLTPENLIAIFLQNETILPNYKEIKVKSSYLDTPLKNGIYQAEFIFFYDDNSQMIFQCKIINDLKLDEEKNNILFYSCLVVISSLMIIGIFIYKKRS